MASDILDTLWYAIGAAGPKSGDAPERGFADKYSVAAVVSG